MPSAHTLSAEARRPTVRARAVAARLRRRPWWREPLIFLAFCALTALLTWPYVNYLRDAVADPGDPYLVSWILWWDYHQTFTDPLNLFHANIFYPYPYTLAFSENCYGIALPFFPLFALGARPLTVHAVAMFLGFAACGYGAFRLARTLTGSSGVAWVAGVVFAFVPYRFHLLSHLPYLFSCWVPLLLEALVLFARARTRRRAAWLGGAIFLTGLTTVSWFTLSLVPCALSAAYLVVRYRLARDGDFWRRGALAVAAAGLLLAPFLLPYYIVSRRYGFVRSLEEVRANSALPIHWLVAEGRNKLWSRFGANLPEAWKFKLFPGLLPLLLSLAAVLLVGETTRSAAATTAAQGRGVVARRRLTRWLDALSVCALVLALVSTGYQGTYLPGFDLWGVLTPDRALLVLSLALLVRLCVAYPAVLRRGEHLNLLETMRASERGDAYWLGCICVVVGFCYSLGVNFFFYRILYDLVPLFKSMRVPTRGAIFCYLGLALLAGLGTRRLAEALARRRTRLRAGYVYAAAVLLLLCELNAAPLRIERGEVYPDAVTLRLRETQMRGGIVVLPAGPDFNHRYILRAADHMRPLIVGTSGFNPPYEDQIEILTREGRITTQFLDLLERIPASYLVVENQSIAPSRREDYEALLVRGLLSGRLRFIRRFDGRSDLYAVTKTEPEARAEEAPPFALAVREWDAALAEDTTQLLGEYEPWSELVYRLHVAAYGSPPRFEGFVEDVRRLGAGVALGSDDGAERLDENARRLVAEWVARAEFLRAFRGASEEQFVARLFANAGLDASDDERAALADQLRAGAETRAGLLLKVARDERFARREHARALTTLYYFGYLRRNPGDPPDRDLSGFDFWVGVVESSGGNASSLAAAFKESGEYKGRVAQSVQ